MAAVEIGKLDISRQPDSICRPRRSQLQLDPRGMTSTVQNGIHVDSFILNKAIDRERKTLRKHTKETLRLGRFKKTNLHELHP